MKAFLSLLLCSVLPALQAGPPFFGQNGASRAPFLPTISSGTYQLVLIADDLTAGSSVSTGSGGWSSRVGGYVAEQVTVSKRPLVTANVIGTRNGVTFDQVDDGLLISSFSSGGLSGLTVFVVGTLSSVGASYGVIAELSSDYSSGAGRWVVYYGDSNAIQAGSGESGTLSLWRSSSSIVTASPFYSSFVYDRSLSSNENTGWVNGTSSGTRPLNNNLSGTFGTDALYIGQRASASLPIGGSICALIVCSGALSTTDRQAIEAVLDAYY